MDHVCRNFRMKCEAYSVEDEGKLWVLHVFDVAGEEDQSSVTLRVEPEDVTDFQSRFESAFGVEAARRSRERCEDCRDEDWEESFHEVIQTAYDSMEPPPVPVGGDQVPEVVRLCLERMLLGEDVSDLNQLKSIVRWRLRGCV